jgi:hypothetical protein
MEHGVRLDSVPRGTVVKLLVAGALGVVLHHQDADVGVLLLTTGCEARLAGETDVRKIDVAALLARDAEAARLLHDKGLDGASAWEERGWRMALKWAAELLDEERDQRLRTARALDESASGQTSVEAARAHVAKAHAEALAWAVERLDRIAPPPVPLGPDEAAAEIATLRRLLAGVVGADDARKSAQPAAFAEVLSAIDAARKHLGDTAHDGE